MRIKQFGDPILRETSTPISAEAVSSPAVQSTLSTLKDVLNGIQSISSENGNALSAPQIGHSIRMILLRLNGEFVPMLNPEIKSRGNATFEFEEECFSFYNLRAKVSRDAAVTVDFMDENGQQQTMELEGEAAGLIQHEIDHLNGVLFLDRVEDNDSLSSIDFLLEKNQPRLRQVKEMIDYMTGQ